MTPPPEIEEAIEHNTTAEDEPMVKSWERFFKTYYREQLSESILAWPHKRSIEVNWFHVQSHDENLGQFLLSHPDEAIEHASAALANVDLPGVELTGAAKWRPHVRVMKLPITHLVEVRDLRAEHLNTLVAVPGLVKKTTAVAPLVKVALYECKRCHCVFPEEVEDVHEMPGPVECPEDHGGCGKSAKETRFKLITRTLRGQSSKMADLQHVEIQEFPETLQGGEQPKPLTLYVSEDLCGDLKPGMRVTVNGILRDRVERKNNVPSPQLLTYLDVHSVEKAKDERAIAKTIDETKERRFREMSKNPRIYEEFVAFIAPTLFGLDVEKMTLLLQMFGGVRKATRPNQFTRGDLHVLLVGDPGVAKSQLVRFMAGLAPRGIYTSGKSSSGAGLTAAAVKDEFGGGRWSLEAGAMVLADHGLLCVDEIDKMDKSDQSSMHEGMEQQTISVAKAGITATLQSRCSVLGAANPKSGRFDEFTPIPEQISFPPALLSRFDVIFVLQDKPNVEKDRQLADFILGNHAKFGALERERVEGSDEADEDAEERKKRQVAEKKRRDVKKSEEEREKEFREYVAYARAVCVPVLVDGGEAHARLAAYYVDLRRQAQSIEGSGAVPITARQLEALIRLSEASAKVRLAREVALEDAERAIKIYEYYMRRIGNAEGGILDVDLVASGVSANLRNTIGTVKNVIRKLEAANDDGAAWADVVTECEKVGVPLAKLETTVERLKQMGEVYQGRTDNHLKLV